MSNFTINVMACTLVLYMILSLEIEFLTSIATMNSWTRVDIGREKKIVNKHYLSIIQFQI